MKSLFLLCLQSLWFVWVVAIPLAVSAQVSNFEQALGDPSELLAELREEIVSIPQLPSTTLVKAPPLVGTLFQPQGDGPFAVVVLSHGSPGRASVRQLMGRYRLIPQINGLVNQGLAVLVPMRRGYGASPGEYVESIGYCAEPRYEKTGAESAQDIRAAIRYISTRSSLNANQIVLMGQSAGGFASIAAASANPPGVVAVLNLSGGRGGNGMDGVPCRPDLMTSVMMGYAQTMRAPALWFYVENDKYFGPEVAKSWFAAFESAGAKGIFVMHPPYGPDGHLLFYAKESIPIWMKSMNDFFKSYGLASLTDKP